MQANRNAFTLITGASQGIGKALAMECARRGMNLLLVALPDNWLEDTAEEIRKNFSVGVLSFGTDLSDEGAPEKIYEFTRKENIRINILINNAGFGLGGLFNKHPLKKYLAMIRLNTSAMVALIHYFLDDLRSFPESHILNMSSMEATLPIPYKTTYTGTKNFIYAFSLALNEEFRPDNIKITVVCPGPVITNEDGLKRFKAQGAKAKLLVKMPDEVARIAVTGMLKGKTVVIPGLMNLLIARLMCMVPVKIKMRMLERTFRINKDL